MRAAITNRFFARSPWWLAVLLVAAGCHGSADGTSTATPAAQFQGQYPIQVVCTTGMVADIVRNVGGSHVAVTSLMGEGVDPHLYRASAGDVSRLNQADIVFYSGLHLEGKMSDVLERMAQRKPVHAVSQKLMEAKDPRLLEIGDGYYDPHIWFDISLWREAVAHVGEVMAEYDPPNTADYRRNTEQYLAELDELHAWTKEQIASIPEERRVLVTAHDAFHYFGRAYGIEVKAIQGVSTDTEAGVRKINELVEFIATRGIKAVFVETSVSDRKVQALVEGSRQRGHDVTIGGTLFSDAMGEAGTPEGTYLGMVRHNVDTIVGALK